MLKIDDLDKVRQLVKTAAAEELMSRFGAMQAEMQEKLRETEVEANSGGGMVTVRCNGLGEVMNISIEPEVVDPDERGLLEDLVRAAVNEAQARAKQEAQQKLRDLLGGLPVASNLELAYIHAPSLAFDARRQV